MPRPVRYGLPGVAQHIVQRGNNRQPTFFDDADYRFYLECLREASGRQAVSIHAYVLMTNHVHLLATPNTPHGISGMLQSVGRRYVQWINWTYRRSGTLWEGRHKASLVQSDLYLLTCHRYIELNPVRAGMAVDPAAYPWSSYRSHALGLPDPVVHDHSLYLSLGYDAESRQAAYRELFRQHVDPQMLSTIRSSTERCAVLGNDRFREDIEATLNRRIPRTSRGRPSKTTAKS